MKLQTTGHPAITLDTPRASDLRVSLQVAGVTGAAQEAILRETAQARHTQRVAAARAGLIAAAVAAMPEGAEDPCPWDDPASPTTECVGRRDHPHPSLQTRRLAAAIGFADSMGIGGRDGVGGDSTLRIPALRGLGKGRKQASDGAAWSAAIDAATWDLCPRITRTRTSRIMRGMMAEPELVEWTEHAHDVFAPDVSGTIFFGQVTPGDETAGIADWDVVPIHSAVPYGWLVTIAREGLRRAAGADPWHPMVPMHAPASSIGYWAEAVNALDAARVARCSCDDVDNERPAAALLSDAPTCPGCFGADGTFAATAWGAAKTAVSA